MTLKRELYTNQIKFNLLTFRVEMVLVPSTYGLPETVVRMTIVIVMDMRLACGQSLLTQLLMMARQQDMTSLVALLWLPLSAMERVDIKMLVW